MYIMIKQGLLSTIMSISENRLDRYTHVWYVLYLSDIYGIYCSPDQL